MATSSFREDLVLDTPEAVANMEKAIERAGEIDKIFPYREVELCTDREFLAKFGKGAETRRNFSFEKFCKVLQSSELSSQRNKLYYKQATFS